MKLEVGKKYTDGRDVVEVKFLDCQGTAWCVSDRNYCRYILSDDTAWQEVTDTPEPGEGWRLLDADEDVEKGDEYFSIVCGRWLESNNYRTNNCKQTREVTYRRRIAPQYVPYTWEDREELRGRWYRKKGDNSEFMVNYVTRHNQNEICIGPWRADEFLGGCEWLDGTPCGKKPE